MCIIVVAEDKMPSKKFLERCENENPHGMGVAWRSTNHKGQVVVNWKKGLTAAEIHDMIEAGTVTLPAIFHARITSSGSNRFELNHPFPIGGDLDLEGHSKEGVLFHNGTWNEWQGVLYRTMPKKLPNGEFNDSRTMAYIAQLWGLNWLQLPAQYNRIAVMTPDKIRLFGRWVKEYGFWLSHTMKYGGNLSNLAETDRPFQGMGFQAERTRQLPMAASVGSLEARISARAGVSCDSSIQAFDGQPEPPIELLEEVEIPQDVESEIAEWFANQGVEDNG